MDKVNVERPLKRGSGFSWLRPDIRFDANGLVSSPDWIWSLPFVGALVIVPPGTCAVLTLRSGRRRVFPEGMHNLRHLGWSVYPVHYVDARRHRTRIPLTEALCKDGWRGGLALEVFWRVADAPLIVDAVDPLGDLVSAAQASMRAVVESTSHDKLIGGMAKQVADADALAQTIAGRLQANPAIQGLQILRILVADRRGDERRIEIVQETTVEQTQLAEQHRLELQRISRDTAVLSERMGLEQERRALALFEAETKRKQIEEEHKVRIREAEIEAEVTARLMPAKWQETQLELAADTCRQQYELMGRAVDAYAQILGEAAKVTPLESWGISSRRRPEFGFESRDATLSQGLASLQALLLQPTPASTLNDVPLHSWQSALLARLVAELSEISQLDEVQTWHIGPNGSEGYKVRIHCQHIALDIACHPGYPSEQPDVVVSDDGHGPAEITFTWAEGMTLKDIILEATRCLAHSPPKSDKAE